MKIRMKEEKTVEVTPELLARMFSELDGDEQAKFFDVLAKIATTEWIREEHEGVYEAWDTQAYNIVSNLEDNGKEIILLLAQHCNK